MKFKGTVHRYGRDIDTDVIIPARYLNTSDPAELAKHCLEDLDTEFVNNVQPGDIIVADENFAAARRASTPPSPSSGRVDVVIAKSFARIFYRNAINTGLAIMECPEAVDAISNGDIVSVDADAGASPTRPRARPSRPSPSRRSSWRSSTREASCPAGRRSSERTRSMTTTYKICLLAGDGIGPEIIAEA